MSLRVAALALCLGAAACDEPDEETEDDTGVAPEEDSLVPDDSDTTEVIVPPEDTAAAARAAAEYQALYDPDLLHSVALTLTDADIAALSADPTTYVPATVTLDGQTFEQVGVRLRGGPDGEDWSAKPAFRIRLDAFDLDTDFAGLERIVLDNLADDPTQLRLVMALKLLNDAGLPAPRAVFTTLQVNGEDFGLYVNVEEVDERFVNHHFADDGGTLWEAEDSADFTAAGVNHLEWVAGDNLRTRLDDAARLCATENFYDDTNTIIDLKQFVTYWSWTIAVGTTDSYPYDLNDFYTYDNPEDGRFEVIPWALDEGWDTGMSWDAVSGTLGFRCRSDPDCFQQIKDATTVALTAIEAADVPGQAQTAADLVEATVQTDPRRSVALSEVWAAQARFLSRVGTWPDRVRADMGI